MKPELQVVNGGKDELHNDFLNLMFFGHLINGDEAAGAKAREIGRTLNRRGKLNLISSHDSVQAEPNRCEE